MDGSNETATQPPTTPATVTASTTVDTAPPSHATATTSSVPGPETLIPVVLVMAAVLIALVVACILFRRRQVRRKKHFSRQLEMTNRRIRAIGMLKERAEHELASWPHQNTPDPLTGGEVHSAMVAVGNATLPQNDSSFSSIPQQPLPMGFPVEVRSIQRRHSANTLNIPQVVCSLGSVAAQCQHIQRHSSDYFLSAAHPTVRGFSNRFSRIRIADSACPAGAGNEAHIMTDTEVKVASHTATQGSSFAQPESSNAESFYPSSACESPCWCQIDPSKVGVVVREQWTGTPLASETSTITDSQTFVSSHATHQSEKWV